MRGLACLFLFALASPFIAGLFSVLMGPLMVVLLVLGLPAVFWHRWKHPERFMPGRAQDPYMLWKAYCEMGWERVHQRPFWKP
jgi:hypothetical protein